MLRLVAAQAETLWDDALPVEVRELPADLAALDELLSGPGLLEPFVACWQREAFASGVSTAGHGRPTIAIETYVRLMVLKARHGWDIGRWSRRSQTRFTCGASGGSLCPSGCLTSRRFASSRSGSDPRRSTT